MDVLTFYQSIDSECNIKGTNVPEGRHILMYTDIVYFNVRL